MADDAHGRADKILKENGHKMHPWSNVNTSHCSVCNRQAKITNVYTRDGAKFGGPAFWHECDEHNVNTSRDVWHWEYNAQMV